MKHILCILLALLLGNAAHAELRVFATVPEWAALAKEIGGEKLKVYSATTAFQDPHRQRIPPT